VTAAVRKNVETAQHKAVDVYGELVERGQKVVKKRQGATTRPRTTSTPRPVAKKTAAKKTAAVKTAPKDLGPQAGLDVKAPLGKPAGTTNS
jgi:hypothetical protein